MNIAFYILGFSAVAGALLAIRLRNLVHATLCLIFFFVALAGIFVLLLAEFIAAVQILVYVGAVGILILFAIMLTHHVTGEAGERIDARGWLWGLAGTLAVFLTLLLPALLLTVLPGVPAEPAFSPSARNIGLSLMSPYVIALQVMGLLLTAALVGAVVIASEPDHKNGEGKK